MFIPITMTQLIYVSLMSLIIGFVGRAVRVDTVFLLITAVCVSMFWWWVYKMWVHYRLAKLQKVTKPLLDEYELDFGDTDSGRKFLSSTPKQWHEMNVLQGFNSQGVDFTRLALGIALDVFSSLLKAHEDAKKHPLQIALEMEVTPYLKEARHIASTYSKNSSAFAFCFMGLAGCGLGCYLNSAAAQSNRLSDLMVAPGILLSSFPKLLNGNAIVCETPASSVEHMGNL